MIGPGFIATAAEAYMIDAPRGTDVAVTAGAACLGPNSLRLVGREGPQYRQTPRIRDFPPGRSVSRIRRQADCTQDIDAEAR